MTKSETTQVIAAANKSAATYLDESGMTPFQTTRDWDSAEYDDNSSDWSDAAWPLYVDAMQGEINRLQDSLASDFWGKNKYGVTGLEPR